jgi:hypothetical protein
MKNLPDMEEFTRSRELQSAMRGGVELQISLGYRKTYKSIHAKKKLANHLR